MIVIIRNGSEETSVQLENGATVQQIRDCVEELEEIGAPSSYTFAVNGQAVEDNHVLASGAVVTFRPRTSEKG